MARSKVVIVMGSDSDWDTMESCYKQMKELGLTPDVEVMSAHRTPDKVHAFATTAQQDGVKVIIAAAGMSAALAGTIAAQTTLPVIGVPMESGSLNGVDALLSTVQMPPGIPVASVGLGKAGATNAAILAMQILAISDQNIDGSLKAYKTKLAESVDKKNKALKERLSHG